MMEEDVICPACNTGVLQAMGDLAGHLVCSVCSAQSQDVILEEVDDFVAANARGWLAASGPSAQRTVAQVKTIDPQAEVMVYLKCLQRLIQAQQETITKWYSCKAYNGVVKQIWKLAVLHNGLLNLGHLKAFVSVDDSDDEEWEAYDEAKELAANPVGKRGRKAGKVSASSTNLASLVYTCTQRFSMMNTLCCQLLTAWTLKLPMWAKDIMEAAREGDLPYIAAIGMCEDLLKGHPVARRALRNPYLATSDAGLVALTQTLATNINVVVPELNLGAFVHRHCASLGLPSEVAVLATHLALSRQVNTREHGMPEHNKKRTRSSFASAQYVEVFLPILAVCKHVLKTASMNEEAAGNLTADAMRPWIQAGQRLLELRHLKHQQRYQMALHESVDGMLKYTQFHSLHDSYLPGALAKAQQSLQAYAEDLEQKHPPPHGRKQDDQGIFGDVMDDSGNPGDIASQVYAQLVRLIAVEIGLDVLSVDVLAVQYYKDLLQ